MLFTIPDYIYHDMDADAVNTDELKTYGKKDVWVTISVNMFHVNLLAISFVSYYLLFAYLSCSSINKKKLLPRKQPSKRQLPTKAQNIQDEK